MKLKSLAMLAGILSGFVRDACIVNSVRRFELHAVQFRHVLQAVISAAGTSLDNVLGQVHAFGRSIGSQIVRTPLHIHFVFSFQ